MNGAGVGRGQTEPSGLPRVLHTIDFPQGFSGAGCPPSRHAVAGRRHARTHHHHQGLFSGGTMWRLRTQQGLPQVAARACGPTGVARTLHPERTQRSSTLWVFFCWRSTPFKGWEFSVRVFRNSWGWRCVLGYVCAEREMPEKADELSAVCVCANTNEILYKNLRPTRAKLALAVFGLSLVSLVLALHTLCAAQTQVRYETRSHFAPSAFAIWVTLLHAPSWRFYCMLPTGFILRLSQLSRCSLLALLCTDSTAAGNLRFIYSSAADGQGWIAIFTFLGGLEEGF